MGQYIVGHVLEFIVFLAVYSVPRNVYRVPCTIELACVAIITLHA